MREITTAAAANRWIHFVVISQQAFFFGGEGHASDGSGGPSNASSGWRKGQQTSKSCSAHDASGGRVDAEVLIFAVCHREARSFGREVVRDDDNDDNDKNYQSAQRRVHEESVERARVENRCSQARRSGPSGIT